MTESRVEQLLSQMTLEGPSTELNERVSATIHGVKPAYVSGRSVSWGVLTAVAVVCLLIGAVAGQAMNRSEVASNGDSDSDEMKAVSEVVVKDDASEASDHVRIVKLRDHEGLWSRIQGPRVAMLCALRTEGSASEQCLQCHSGLPDAESRFRDEHMLNPNFATCMWCHDTNELHGVR
jgi:hypothetical protein